MEARHKMIVYQSLLNELKKKQKEAEANLRLWSVLTGLALGVTLQSDYPLLGSFAVVCVGIKCILAVNEAEKVKQEIQAFTFSQHDASKKEKPLIKARM